MKLSDIPDPQRLSQTGQGDAQEQPSLGHQLWQGLKDFIQIPEVARAKAPQMGRDIAEGVTGFGRDLGQSLNPFGNRQQSAAAGGRVLGKLGDVAALLSGGFAGPTMPPAGIRQPVGGTLRATPAMREAAAAEPALAKTSPMPNASPLATAMVKNDSVGIDRHLARKFQQAVSPGRIPFATQPKIDAQTITTQNAIDNIIANKGDIKLTDLNDRAMKPGSTPKSLYQFGQAIAGLKRQIYNQYNNIAKQAGGAGVQIPLQPSIDALMQTASSPAVLAAHPEIMKTAAKFAGIWSEIGSMSPTDMEDLITNMNATYKSANPTKEIISERTLMQPVLEKMRGTLDQAIMSAQGPGYAPLKKQYGELLSIEKDVANAIQRDAKNIPGGLGAVLANTAAALEFTRGFVLMSPEEMAAGAAIKGVPLALRWLNSPNRAIEQMFSHRARQGQIVPLSSPIPGAMGMAQTGFVAGQRPGDIGPNGGRIIARTPTQ